MSDLGRINTNVAALRAYLHLSQVNDKILKAAERLSTGSVVNRASDDPARYGVKRVFERTIATKYRFNENIERGVDWLQTNDSQLAGIVDMLRDALSYAVTGVFFTGGVVMAGAFVLTLFLKEIPLRSARKQGASEAVDVPAAGKGRRNAEQS